MKNIIKKWWFWLIIILILGSIIGGINKDNINVKESNIYNSKYEWNYKDAKTEELNKFVVLGIENQNGDLEAGEYTIKTNNNKEASFTIIITNQYYEKISEIPGTYDGIVQGFDNSEYSTKLIKGQYMYLIQASNGQGKAIVTKK